MTLVKATEFEQKGQRGYTFNLGDIEREAHAMIETARSECDSIRRDAQEEISRQREQACQEGKDQGFQEGIKTGREEGLKKAFEEARESFARDGAETLKALQSTFGEFESVKSDLLWQGEQGMVALAIAVAEKVIKQTANENPDITAVNVKEALELVTRNTDVTVKVNPKDIEHLDKTASKNKDELSKFKSVRFEPDETVSRGGCCLVTENGGVDARLETQIERIARELLMSMK